MNDLCEHWLSDRYCGATSTRLYLCGPRCQAHSPAALAGRSEPVPDPALTLDALRERAGFVNAATATSGLIDDRAIASGRRRANTADYRAAQAREDQRRKGQHA